MNTHQSPLTPLVYTCVMSAFSLPNLEAILTRRPTDVVLVVSDFDKAQEAAKRLAEVLQQREPEIRLHTIGEENGENAFSGNDPLGDQTWIDEKFIPFMESAEFSGKPHWLNLTGGTKSMSLALSTCRHWDGLDYKPENNNELSHFQLASHQHGLLQLQSSAHQPTSKQLDEVAAIDVARLYNPSVETGTPKLKNDDLAAQIFDALQQQDAGLTCLFNLLDHIWHKEEHPEKSITLPRAELIERLDGKATLEDVETWLQRFNALPPKTDEPVFHWDGEQFKLPGNHKSLKGPAKNIKNWLKGDWLEQLVYHWVLEAGVPESGVALNLKGGETREKSDTKREADLLVQHQSRTHIVEVKAAIPANKSAVDIQTQLTSLQDHFGRVSLILFAGPQLVTQLNDQQQQHLDDRLKAGKAKRCNNREELLDALKLTKTAFDTSFKN